MNQLSITRVGVALTVLDVLTYLLCYVWHLLAPASLAGLALQSVFPGFSYSPAGFGIGLGWTIVYSVYTAVLFVFAYNHLGRLEAAHRTREPHQPTH